MKALPVIIIGLFVSFCAACGIVILALLYYFALWFGNRYDTNECMKLKAQSEQGLVGFYIIPAWDATCRAHNIIIHAPVHHDYD